MKKLILFLLCLLTALAIFVGCGKPETPETNAASLPAPGTEGTLPPTEPPAPVTTAGKASDYASMSEKELVEELTNYRHLIDIYAAPDLAAGLADLEKQCGAYAELVTRENWRELLKQYGTELIEGYKENPREDGRTDFVSIALQEIIDFVNGQGSDSPFNGSDGRNNK